jgi:streptogramin lyase
MVGNSRCDSPMSARVKKAKRAPRLALMIAFVGFALTIATSVAFASEGSSDYIPGTSLEDLEEGLPAGAPNVLDQPTTDLQAAEELPHKDLDRGEALELMRSVFWPTIDSTVGVFTELEGAKLLSPNIAAVDPSRASGGQGEPSPMLVESAVPLSTDGTLASDAILDLDLEHASQDLQPANPLVDVGIPTELGEGISLPDQQVTVEVPGAPSERSPTTVAETSAFYPNIAPDSDLIVAPMPTGFETFTQLRSADAPRTLEFDLSLPAGASLQTTLEGGAVSRQGDETLLAVHAPAALDAAGNEVPVDLSVDGHTVILAVSPPQDATYPILVDPFYETFDWEKYYGSEGHYYYSPMAGWKGEKNSPAFDDPKNWTLGQYAGHWGAALASGVHSYDLVPNTRASWRYNVPKYFSDYEKYGVRPTTYIDHVTLKELQYRFDTTYPSSQYSPYFVGGIWDAINNAFVAIAVRGGTEGELKDPAYQYQFQNPNQNVNAKEFGIYLSSNQYGANPERQVWASYATITLADKDAPNFNSLGSPGQWMNDKPTGAIPFAVSDPGLGISSINIANPRPANPFTVTVNPQGCVGGAEKPCPRTWSSTDPGAPQLSYDPSVMPQGENWVIVNAHDPGGRISGEGASPAEVKVKVDHTAPDLKLSGSLTEQEKISRQADYTLKYNATDGFDATPGALAPFGSPGGTNPFKPRGIVSDKQGHVWVVDRENDRVLQFDEEGKYLSQFGSAGTGNGQFLDPRGIALSPNGTLWVADGARGRIQQFNTKGEFLQGFGTKVSAPTNEPTAFVEPWGIASAPSGRIWVSDYAGKRVALFNENAEGQARYVLDAFGSPSNPTGKAELSLPTGIATDASGNVWVPEGGAHRVSVFNSSGKFLLRFGSEGIGNGQFKTPVAVAISPTGHVLVTDEQNNRVQEFMSSGAYIRQFGSTGTANNQFQGPKGITFGANNVAFVAEIGNGRVDRWSGVDLDPQSGVASTEIKVDGNLVEPKYAPGCATKNCSISKEWTLHASNYSSGQHKVKVTTIDGVGLPTTKELTVTADNSVPQLKTISSYFLTPKGWLEQKTYSYSTSFSDTGFGVTSITYKIDGKVVNSVNQSCPSGGCSATLAGTIDMAAYDGGAHAAELVATDAAGNVKTFTKTINVDPKGEISTAEATDTLEALENTSDVNLVGESEEEDEYDGTAPGLGIAEIEGSLQATGTQVPTTLGADPAEGMTMQILEDGTFAIPCESEESQPTEEFEEDADEVGPPVILEGCRTTAELEELAANPDADGLTPIEMTPVQVPASAAENKVVEGNVALSANTASHVDTVVRPLSDGGMTFENIRDGSASENFSWEVKLQPDQKLQTIDSTHVQVAYDDGEHVAFTITAVPAHDAIGTAVPTKLTVSGNAIITLIVEHHAQSFIYPIIAGAGWQGGFQTSIVQMPPPESPEEEEEGESTVESEGGVVVLRGATIGPPIAGMHEAGEPDPEPWVGSPYTMTHKFKFFECRYGGGTGPGDWTPPNYPPSGGWRIAHTKSCRNQVDDRELLAGMAVHGYYHDKMSRWVWINQNQLQCDKWGRDRPAMVHCGRSSSQPVHANLKAFGNYRFAPGKAEYNSSGATCVTVWGTMDAGPTPHQEEAIATVVAKNDPCSWPQL